MLQSSVAIKLLVSVVLIAVTFLPISYRLMFLNQQEQVRTYQHLSYLPKLSNCLNDSVLFLIYQCLGYQYLVLS